MAMKEFQITVDFARARSRGATADKVDIAALVRAIPTAQIMAGDPSIAVQVRVPWISISTLLPAAGRSRSTPSAVEVRALADRRAGMPAPRVVDPALLAIPHGCRSTIGTE
jgi:hypothetical protein